MMMIQETNEIKKEYLVTSQDKTNRFETLYFRISIQDWE